MPPTLEERVTVLEERMDQEAGLRASQDSDLAAIAEGVRAQGRLIQALGQTQSEHTQVLSEYSQQLRDLNSTLASQHHVLEALTLSELQHTEHLARLDRRVHEMDGGIKKIVGMLDVLIERDGDR